MAKDKQFTATGEADVGFQTDGANIKVGADIHGSEAGVKGFSSQGPGVSGEGIDGVRGFASGETTGSGVMGKGNHVGVDGEGKNGIGVRGTGKLCGVFGHIGPPIGFDFGGPPNAAVAGIVTGSINAVGVRGSSKNGRGGVFESTTIAQLRLVPLVNPTPQLPATGEFGDLYVSVTGDDPSVGGTLTINMHLCVSPGDQAMGSVAQWAPFQFGPVVPGG
jgi:hypothetical protein